LLAGRQGGVSQHGKKWLYLSDKVGKIVKQALGFSASSKRPLL